MTGAIIKSWASGRRSSRWIAAQSGCGRWFVAVTCGGGYRRNSSAASLRSSGSGQIKPARRARRMHSPAAVTPIDRLAAIWRLDMPPARSLSTSRILRMGNLCPGMPCSPSKEPRQCRFEDHPTALVTPVHSLVAIARNGWSRSIGTPGRNQLELVVAISRYAQVPLHHDCVRVRFHRLSYQSRCHFVDKCHKRVWIEGLLHHCQIVNIL